MKLWNFLHGQPGLFLFGVTLVGLLVGRLINLLAHRLPIWLQRQWHQEASEVLGLTPLDKASSDLNPHGSICTHCQHQLSAWQKIPVLSYLTLLGKCPACNVHSSPRQFFVEVGCAILSVVTVWHFGVGLETMLALLLVWCLLALSLIDADHQLLPDVLVLPALWLGLLANALGAYVPLADAVWGATAGYLSLWSVYWVFKLTTGKEGMGKGDFKLLALIGAWGGWQVLPMTLLLASTLGALVGLSLLALRKRSIGTVMPFGPYLAAAGWVSWVWGAEIYAFKLQLLGG